MKQKLLIFSLLVAFSANAQIPVFSPSMSIVEDGVVNSPGDEGVASIIDGDTNTKFLDFEYADGMSFIVNLGGTTAAANRFDITTANDSEGRDPMNFVIFGSNDGVSFTSITVGSIPCITDRLTTRTFNFTNSTAYSYYKVLLTDQCSADNSLQVSEVQLFSTSLGINDLILDSKNVLVFPNPSKGSFVVKQATSENIEKVTITDATGKVVKEVIGNQSNELQINTENIAIGVYFAKIYSAGTSVIKKLILN